MGFENQALWDAMKTALLRQTSEQLTELINSCTDLDAAIKESLAIVCKSLHAEVGTFWVYNLNGDGLIRPKAVFGGSDIGDIKLLPGEGICGKTIESGKAMIIEDCQSDPRWAGKVDKKTGFVTKTMLCSPLLYGDASFACIQIINKTDNTYYDDKDMSFADKLGEIIVTCLIKRNLISEFVFNATSAQSIGSKITNVTSMFVDIKNFSKLITRVGIAKAYKTLDNLLIYVTSNVEKYEGSIDKYMGDRTFAVWGVQKEVEEPSFKAVSAAIDIISNKKDIISKLKEETGVEFDFSIGISEGTCYCGVIGMSSKANYTVIGESVNLASKLCRVAKNGSILVDQDIIRALEGHKIKTTPNHRDKVVANGYSVDSYYIN